MWPVRLSSVAQLELFFWDNLKCCVFLFLEVIREKRNCQRAPPLLKLHLYLPGYPHPRLQKLFELFWTLPQFVETSNLSEEYRTVYGLVRSVPPGGQLAQRQCMDLLCLGFNSLLLLTNKPSGSCSTCSHDSWQEL